MVVGEKLIETGGIARTTLDRPVPGQIAIRSSGTCVFCPDRDVRCQVCRARFGMQSTFWYTPHVSTRRVRRRSEVRTARTPASQTVPRPYTESDCRSSAPVPWTPLAKFFGDEVLMPTKTCSDISCPLNPSRLELVAHRRSRADINGRITIQETPRNARTMHNGDSASGVQKNGRKDAGHRMLTADVRSRSRREERATGTLTALAASA